MKIAPTKSTDNWKDEREKLLNNLSDNEAWKSAYQSYFHGRLESRYLIPIKRIKKGDEWEGEGFAITGILCMLIEFCQSFFEGKIYSHRDKNDVIAESDALGLSRNKVKANEQPSPYLYHRTKNLFKRFLLDQEPFKAEFNSDNIAEEFYRNVRSGLVHEAGTKENYKIWAIGSKLINSSGNFKTINRNKFAEFIDEYIKKYGEKILNSENLKRNFARKVDDICQVKRVFYFAYGSNLKENRLIERFEKHGGLVHTHFNTELKDYKIVFNKKSVDNSSKANIQAESGRIVNGVCYEVDEVAFNQFAAYDEAGYNIIDIPAYGYDSSNPDKYIWAKTFISTNIFSNPPQKDYIDIVLEGGKEKGFTSSWENQIKTEVDYLNLN